jgi:hypothetical protein
MKQNQRRSASITTPLVKDLVERQKAESKQLGLNVKIGSTPVPAPDLYQDSGSGYNPDFTFPQE